MSAYAPLFRIDVEHEYYANGVLEQLRFIPTAQTAKLIDQTGCLIHCSAPNCLELHVYYDDLEHESRLHSVVKDAGKGGVVIAFIGCDTGLKFNSISEPFVAAPGYVALGARGKGVVDNNHLRLHPEPVVNDQDMIPLEPALLLSDLLALLRPVIPRANSGWQANSNSTLEPANFTGFSRSELAVIKPICMFSIVLTESDFDDQDKPPSTQVYILRFGARKTYWKYYLLGTWVQHQGLELFDSDNEISFTFLGEVALADHRPALAFISEQPIALQDRSSRKFQLREGNSQNSPLLIKRLPVANAKQFGLQDINGKQQCVSEIFINGSKKK